uniref:Putative tetratricopeptide repeat protein n=1 Tax=viral metagenome TaxID=1070528 RepID=A0A6M3K4A9_9ZZZZ
MADGHRRLKSSRWYLGAVYFERAGRWEEMLYCAQKAYALDSTIKVMLAYQGRALIELQRYDEAEVVLLAHLKNNPWDLNTLTNLTIAYVRSSRIPQAAEIAKRREAIINP